MNQELRMNAYYYSFEPTGCREIDIILSAVASAGKGFHNTADWQDECKVENYGPFTGKNFNEAIQNAANEAARLWKI